MDEKLLDNFKQVHVSRKQQDNFKSEGQGNGQIVYDGRNVYEVKKNYSDRVYEHNRLESVMFLDGPVTEHNTLLLRLQLHEFIRLKTVSDELKGPHFVGQHPGFLVPPYIILSIRSPGGDMIAAMALCSVIKTVQKLGTPVIGVVNGIAYSAGFMIMTACQYRYMLPHSHAMSHEAKTGISGTMTGMKYKQAMLNDYDDMGLESLLEIEKDICESEAYKEFLERNEYQKYEVLMSDNQGVKLDEELVYFIKKYVELPSVDNFLRFSRAKKLGLIHGVITEGVYAKLLACPFSPNRKGDLSHEIMDGIFESDTCKSCHSQVMREYMEKIKAAKPAFNNPSHWPVIPPMPYTETPVHTIPLEEAPPSVPQNGVGVSLVPQPQYAAQNGASVINESDWE